MRRWGRSRACPVRRRPDACCSAFVLSSPGAACFPVIEPTCGASTSRGETRVVDAMRDAQERAVTADTASGVIVHLNGWPGVGKQTIGRILAQRINARFIHNHLLHAVGILCAEPDEPAPAL